MQNYFNFNRNRCHQTRAISFTQGLYKNVGIFEMTQIFINNCPRLYFMAWGLEYTHLPSLAIVPPLFFEIEIHHLSVIRGEM